MSTKFNIMMAFVTATNCALWLADDKPDNNWLGYMWGLSSGLYTVAAVGKAREQAKEDKRSNGQDRFDIM